GHTGSHDLAQRRLEQEEPKHAECYVIPTDLDGEHSTLVHSRLHLCQAYVELNELVGTTWQETGRWVGYEESFNPYTSTWGASHVSYLTFKSLIQLRRIMSTGVVLLDVEDFDLSSIAEKIVNELENKNEIRSSDRDALLNALLQKRSQNDVPQVSVADIQLQTFSVTRQVALLHLSKPVVAFMRLQDSVVMDGILEAAVPVRFIFMLVGPSHSGVEFHECGRAMGTLMADWVFSLEAYLAQDEKELTNAIANFMDCSIVIPPTPVQSEAMLKPLISFQKKMLHDRVRPADSRIVLGKKPEEDPLARTGYPFGGLVKDIKRRYKHYISDFTDGLSIQVLSAIIFIYFAALSPAITFGGLLAEKTENLIGVSEMMISTSVQGMIFCLLAAQPVLVIGFSGPLLVFEVAFFEYSDVEYIVGRTWVGIWLIVIVLVFVATEASFLVRFISRFTQEIFSILISFIFIYETFSKLLTIFLTHPLKVNYSPLNESGNPFESLFEIYTITDTQGNVTSHKQAKAFANTALLSMCLMFGCFFIAYFFRQFKNSIFLPGPIRRIIGDFGVPIAIFIMVAIDFFIDDTYTQKLVVPKGLTVSNPNARTWIIHPMGINKTFPIWLIFACFLPALLVFILIFLESQITTLIVSKPERKMVKGSGFHWDLLLIVAMGGVASIFGCPWFSAATVRSVTHANALTVMTKGPKPEIERVLEQRVSGFLVALLVGLSILMEPVLKLIPLAALFGIFLYMGITSLSGVQLWDRTMLLIVPKKHHPAEPYATLVKTWRMHLFTIIQLFCLAVLWAVKSTLISLALPFVLILTIPLRLFMSRYLFTDVEMKCLDSDDAKVTFEEELGVDVYDESPFP
uniref:Anion exchange protein n=1 Tax=Electrophorus electricus TaxID=8005 RepID=A0A4W4DWS2_ELEEL